jgi:hypothetical protein
MGRVKTKATRIQVALWQTVSKLRKDIEELHAKELEPADYSIGFTNGLIFAEHKISERKGKPKFYTQRTSIGALPKPVHLVTDDEIMLRTLMDEVVRCARIALDTESHSGMNALAKAVGAYDGFLQTDALQKEAPEPLENQPLPQGSNTAPSPEPRVEEL